MDPAVIIYIAETNMPKYRGIFLSLTGPCILVGILISYILGHYLFWQHAALTLATFSAICFILCFVLPESPVWLVAKDRIKEAVESLKWFHSGTQIADTELEELKNARMLKSEEDADKVPLLRKVICTKAWKPLGILALFFCVQQFTGNSIIFYYAVNFYESFDLPIDGFTLSIIYITISLIASIICTAIIERYNRKTMTVISSAGVCATCAMAAIYEYFFEKTADKPLFWFPITCMWINIVFSTLGISPLPWLMAGEMFPSQVRGAMSGLLWAISYLFMFVTVKLYPVTAILVNIYGVLWIFAGSALIGILFGLYILPDTRGKTLIEIENFW